MEQPVPVIFEQLFDIDELQTLQDQFAGAFGVASVITTPNGEYLTKPSNFSHLCQNIIRCTEEGLSNCMHSDAVIGRHNPEGPIVSTCLSGGLWDAGASITVGGRHVANWLIGQVRIQDRDVDEQKMRKYAREIGADEAAFMKSFYEISSTTEERFQKIADLLFTMANQLSEKAFQNDRLTRAINEKKRASEALLESEAKFRNFFEHSPVAKSITGIDGSMQANPAFCQMIGYTMEELSLKKFSDITHPDDLTLSNACLQDVLEGKKSGVEFEKRYIHKSGKVVWTSITIFLQRDDDGKPLYFFSSIIDIRTLPNVKMQKGLFRKAMNVITLLSMLIRI